jgi:hypothetical protein
MQSERLRRIWWERVTAECMCRLIREGVEFEPALLRWLDRVLEEKRKAA